MIRHKAKIACICLLGLTAAHAQRPVKHPATARGLALRITVQGKADGYLKIDCILECVGPKSVTIDPDSSHRFWVRVFDAKRKLVYPDDAMRRGFPPISSRHALELYPGDMFGGVEQVPLARLPKNGWIQVEFISPNDKRDKVPVWHGNLLTEIKWPGK